MRLTLRINTSKAWYKLETVAPVKCILSKLGDIHPYQHGPVIQAQTVIFDQCDKNFVRYWLNNTTFPRLKKLILHSDHTDSSVVHWIARNSHVQTFLHESRYVCQCGLCRSALIEAPNIEPIGDIKYRELLKY